jgi:Bacterial mobilisation protein (MobC)
MTTHVIKTRVAPEMKVRVNEEAQRQLLTESIWLRRVVDAALRNAPVSEESLIRRAGSGSWHERFRDGHRCEEPARTRICLRIRHGDRLILRERAEARGMPAATYIAALVRAHLRTLAPLPCEEVAALKRSIAELSAIGRNLNQIARAAHQTGRITGPNRDDLRSMLKVCEAMREHIKELVRANRATWDSGYAEAVG